MRNILKIAFLLFLCWSCKPELDVEVPNVKKQLVVDGWIENGGYPMVILTYNSAFFSNLDSTSLRKLVASKATVIVSDGNDSEFLTYGRDNNYFPSYVYEGNEFVGAKGKTYYLTVIDSIGGTIHAKTTIPKNAPTIDSLWMEYINNNDTMGLLKVRFTDNPDERNFYRTFTELGNSNHFIPTLSSCYSDQYFNGKTVTFSLNKGTDSLFSLISNIYFRKGDSIMLKFSNIDEISYNFWLAYQESVLNASSPFSSDHNHLVSNTDKGLGIWCGYNSSYYGIITK
jgi:hypothetical protein